MPPVAERKTARLVLTELKIAAAPAARLIQIVKNQIAPRP